MVGFHRLSSVDVANIDALPGALERALDRGGVRIEIGGVVKVFDVGTVGTEYVIAVDSREVLDHMVDHPVLPGHLLT